jgi:hypothetical protein
MTNIHCPHGKDCTTKCLYPYLNTKEGILPCDELARRKVAAAAEAREQSDTNEAVDALLANVHTFAQFKDIENALLDEVAELESGENRMVSHSQDVAATMRQIADATKAGAARLLASIGIKVDVKPEAADADVAQLEARLAAERRAGAEATAALEIVRERLEKKRRLLKGLEGRRQKYLKDAMREAAEPLGPLYVKQLNDLRRTYSLLGALSERIGSFDKYDYITFPRPRLDTTKLNPNEKFMISIDNEHRAFWRSVASQLDADPKARIKLPIS